MERRFLKHEAELTVHERRMDDGRSVISGYAAVHYDGTPETEYELWEGAVERIMAGSFDRAAKSDDVRALFNHDPSEILGRRSAGSLKLGTDETGLWYRVQMAATDRAKDLLAHIERGDISASSFSFDVTDEEWKKKDDTHIREIRAVRLYDVGPVTFPAYEATTAEAKSAAGGHRHARLAFRRWQAREGAAKLQALEKACGKLSGTFDDMLSDD